MPWKPPIHRPPGWQRAKRVRTDALDRAYGTQALAAFVMEAYADPGAICFEPFSGSGTSIIAGQRTGRHVRAIELAPVYADVTLRRWQLLYPDAKPVLDRDGRTYDEIAAERRQTEA